MDGLFDHFKHSGKNSSKGIHHAHEVVRNRICSRTYIKRLRFHFAFYLSSFPLQISKYAASVVASSILTRSSTTESLYNYCCIGRYAIVLLSLISRFDTSSPLLSFAMTPTEISGVARSAPLHIFYGAKFGFMYPFKLRTLLKNIIIASASVGSAFDPSSSFKTMMMAAFKAPLLLVSSSHRAEGTPHPPSLCFAPSSHQNTPTTYRTVFQSVVDRKSVELTQSVWGMTDGSLARAFTGGFEKMAASVNRMVVTSGGVLSLGSVELESCRPMQIHVICDVFR